MQQDSRRYLVALALLLAGAACANLLWSKRPTEVSYRVSFDQVPDHIGTLAGERVPVEQRIFNYLGADAMEEVLYRNEDTQVRLSLVYGTDWRAVHSPLSCLPQMGWQVDRRELVHLSAPPNTPHQGPLHGQLLTAHRNSQKLMVLYLFAHQGGTTGDMQAQAVAVMRNPRGSGGLIISASTPVVTETDTTAQALLKQVCTNVYLPAVDFWYK